MGTFFVVHNNYFFSYTSQDLKDFKKGFRGGGVFWPFYPPPGAYFACFQELCAPSSGFAFCVCCVLLLLLLLFVSFCVVFVVFVSSVLVAWSSWSSTAVLCVLRSFKGPFKGQFTPLKAFYSFFRPVYSIQGHLRHFKK